MAFLEVRFFSKALGLCCGANVILPQGETRAQGREIPVLYLLHGLSDDHTAWARRTSIERYADSLAPEFAIIMPAAEKSFYTDMKRGKKYWTYVSEELPQIMGSIFPLSQKREDTFAAGLSMGGYGAVKLAFNRPERFLACASLSGVCDMGAHLAQMEPGDEREQLFRNIFGSEKEFLQSENDLLWQAEKVSKGRHHPAGLHGLRHGRLPYQNNLAFLAHLRKLGIARRLGGDAGRAHTWDYWDEQIQIALKWFVKLRQEAKESK